ncbi:MAG: SDR family NAD(P)-dependent oxidoreductase [Dehalococcoidales bacterium]
MLLKDKVAVITGGAAGIGRGIAVRFAAEGAKVVIADISPDKGEKTAADIKKGGGEAFFVRCDVADGQQVQALADLAVERYGKIDILVNNAGGVSGDAKIEDTTEAAWDKIIDINLKGQFLCCRAVVPVMKKNRYGKIINLSSMGAVSPPAPIVHYHAAKGGVLGLTRDLAVELAHLNITVNAILPGPILTDFYTDILKEQPGLLEKLNKKVPMRRMGTPEDIAGVALFLASGLSSYVTGEDICVGGGLPLSPLDEDKL